MKPTLLAFVDSWNGSESRTPVEHTNVASACQEDLLHLIRILIRMQPKMKTDWCSIDVIALCLVPVMCDLRNFKC